MTNPFKTVIGTILLVAIGYYVQAVLPYGDINTHGSGPYLTLKDPLILKGMEVYREEGCFYCHTKNLRPMAWEMKRFADAEKLGFFPAPSAAEYRFHSPNMMGAERIGPDLSRVATKMSADQLKKAITAKPGSKGAEAFHAYGKLFTETFSARDESALAWEYRALMQGGAPMSEPQQRAGSYSMLKGKTKGDALIAFLSSLGGEHIKFAGSFYK